MRHPLWILNSILALLFLFVIGFVMFSQVTIPPREDAEPDDSAAPIQRTVSEINIAKIYGQDLFETYQAPSRETVPDFLTPFPEPPAPLQVVLPQEAKKDFLSPLPVNLKGIIVFTDDTKNRAIIAYAKTSEESTYKVGDVIEDAQLIKIMNNKAIFLRANGQQEVLYLREKDAEEDPTYKAATSWSDVVLRMTDTTFMLNPHEFTLRVKNLAQFIDFLNLTPVYHKGKSIGMRIGAVKESSLGKELGLVTDDIITHINDIPATTTPNRFKIYKNIMSLDPHSTIRVNLLRGGAQTTLTYSLQRFKQGDAQAIADAAQQEIATRHATEEKIQLLKERHRFMPTLDELRKRERQNMLNRGGAPRMRTHQNPEESL